MIITATQFKTNLKKYLEAAASEDVLITKNGKIIAQLSKPQAEKLAILNTLVGCASSSRFSNLEDIREERLSKKWLFF